MERLEAYCGLHKTAKESKVDSLIAGLSGLQYQTLKSLVFPKKPIEKSFENPRSEIFKFKFLVRTKGETIQHFQCGFVRERDNVNLTRI